MLKFIVLQGLPASGKTTLARQIVSSDPKRWIRVNNDDLRAMFWGQIPNNISPDERFVSIIRNLIVVQAMNDGKNIIIDNVNLNPKRIEEYISRVEEWNGAFANKPDRCYEFEVKMVDTTVQECIRRDALRPNPVGAKVITRFYREYLKPKFIAAAQDNGLQKVVICDLDGTLCLFGDENPYDRDYSKDIVNEPVRLTLNKYLTSGYRILFVSGRMEKLREVSTDWIENNLGYKAGQDFDLLMREDGDLRDDAVVKQEIHDKFIKDKYYVEFILDDRQRVVDMWRSLGLTVFQVADGNF